MKVYIAAPYSIGDQLENVVRTMSLADELMSYGFVPHLPLLSHFWHEHSPKEWETWIEYDKHWLTVCDCVYRIPGESRGADIEVEFAIRHDIPVVESLDELIRLRDYLHSLPLASTLRQSKNLSDDDINSYITGRPVV